MSAEIQKLIDQFKALKWKSNPYDLACRLIDGNSEDVLTLVEMVLDQLPDAGTFFADAISFVPEKHLPHLAAKATERLRKGGQRETAEAFIAHCSLQRVEALHPLLDDIYELKVNWSTYYSDWRWRKSGLLDFERLKRVAENVSDPKASNEAWHILLETRHPAILNYCAQHIDVVGNVPADREFHDVGFELVKETFRQLYENEVHHLVFPEEYWDREKTPIHMLKRHPTWRLSGAGSQSAKFGGYGTHVCPACGQSGHNLLSLAEIPKSLATVGLTQIRFETCLSCLGWEVPRMFYCHDHGGEVKPVGYKGGRITPQFPAEPFIEAQVQLVDTPPRWQWQDWGVTNSRQNLHRFGGYPCWIQDAEYLQCPSCQGTMSFLFQLDSCLFVGSKDSKSKHEFEWGSGGICYVHWCNGCKVSGYLWQCT